MFMDSFAEYFTDKCETSWTFGDQYLWNSSRHSTFLTLFNQWQESVEHYWEESFHVYMSQWLGPNLASQFINPSWGLVTRGGTDHGESNELRHIFTSFCQVAELLCVCYLSDGKGGRWMFNTASNTHRSTVWGQSTRRHLLIYFLFCQWCTCSSGFACDSMLPPTGANGHHCHMMEDAL